MALNPYASFLDGRDAVAIIKETPARLRELADAIGRSRITAPRAPGKWSARDIVCHLADCEIVFAFRLRQALADDNPAVQPFDQDRWAALYSAQDAETAVATFAALRAWNVALVDHAGAAARSRSLTHPERGEMTFQTVLDTMGGHDVNHLRQLEAIASPSRSPSAAP